jgi:hypothetical protein
MWFIRKLFVKSRVSQRRSLRVVGDLESIERRCLLSVAMPTTEFRGAAPPHEVGAPIAGIAATPGRATTATGAQGQVGIGAIVSGTVGIAANDDSPVDPGQGGGGIPPVIGKVSW